MFYKLLVSVIVAFSFGCTASVTHRPVGKTDSGTGIRYYQSSPYLLVYSDSKGGLQWQILFLPDQTKKMMVAPKVIGGRSEMTLYFHNGILAGSTEVGDTTELPKALIAAVQSVAPLIAAASLRMERTTEKPTPPNFPAPSLYKIVINGNNVNFIGGKGDAGIIVTIKEEKP